MPRAADLMMREACQQVAARRHALPRLDLDTRVQGQLYLGDPREAQERAALALADAFTVTQERTRHEAETTATELQHDVVVLVGAHP